MLQSRFESNDITDNEVGVWLRGGSDDITLVGNHVADNAYAGILVGEQFGSTVVSDNAFSNDRNVRFDPYYDPNTDPDDVIDPDLDVAWNVEPRPELNVVDGAFVGGNYYASPDSDGFSETCVDADVDTLCDAPHELFDGAVDEHPLATPSVRADEPPTSVAPADLSGVTFALDCGPLIGGQSVQFGYDALEAVGIPPDAASRTWSNADVIDVVRDSPLGPAVELLGVDSDDLLWAANTDEQAVRVFADTGLGVRSCTGTIVE
jgi:parallel beta-helix repeat protein